MKPPKRPAGGELGAAHDQDGELQKEALALAAKYDDYRKAIRDEKIEAKKKGKEADHSAVFGDAMFKKMSPEQQAQLHEATDRTVEYDALRSVLREELNNAEMLSEDPDLASVFESDTFGALPEEEQEKLRAEFSLEKPELTEDDPAVARWKGNLEKQFKSMGRNKEALDLALDTSPEEMKPFLLEHARTLLPGYGAVRTAKKEAVKASSKPDAAAVAERRRAKEALVRVPEAYFVFPDEDGKFQVWEWQNQENIDKPPHKTSVRLPREAIAQLKEEPEFVEDLGRTLNELKEPWNSKDQFALEMPGVASLVESARTKRGKDLDQEFKHFMANPERTKIAIKYDLFGVPLYDADGNLNPEAKELREEEFSFSDDPKLTRAFEALPPSMLKELVKKMPYNGNSDAWYEWGTTVLRPMMVDFLVSRNLYHMLDESDDAEPKKQTVSADAEPKPGKSIDTAPVATPDPAPDLAPPIPKTPDRPRPKTEGSTLIKKLAHSAFELQTFNEDPATADIAAVTRGMIDKVRVMVQGRDKPQYDADAVRAVARESFLSAGRDAAEVDTALAEVFGEKTSDTSASTQEKSPTLESSKFDRTDLRAMSAALEQTLVAIPGMSSVLERIPGDPRESIPGLREKVLAHFAKIFSRDLDQLAAQGATDAVRASATKLRDALGGAGIRFDAAKGAFEVTDARRFALLIRAEQRHLIEKGSV